MEVSMELVYPSKGRNVLLNPRRVTI